MHAPKPPLLRLFPLALATLVACSQLACTKSADEERAEHPAPPAAAAPASPAAAAPAASAVPAGVEHVQNKAWVEGPAPTDIPEVKEAAGVAAYAKLASEGEAQLAKACAAGDKVYSLDSAASKVGFISFKNTDLSVPGSIKAFGGFASLGQKSEQRLSFWANLLSLDTGNPGRDARLKKLFFQVEEKENGQLRFEATKIDGLEEGLPTELGAAVTVQIAGKLSLHGAKLPFSFPLKIVRQATGEGEAARWKGELPTSTLLPFLGHDLLAPLEALMKACNHKSIGSSVELFFDLSLVEGCKAK